ncbi:MAG: hypothetical protein QF918_13555 [Pirellulaceae bacterium]|jgi:hypothetical protein|nr:hypothetical protein [Pirellulaceae bacterium]MDP6556793.1 hypothetical protein [Pirellulaceae bacterium]
MTIKVVCQCGASFGAKDELAGRKVACPKCKQPLEIGAAPAPTPAVSGAMSDLLDEAGFDNVQGPRCPKCSKPIQPGALLCVSCGFNLQTGEEIEGAEVKAQAERGDKGVANKLLDGAATRIAHEKLEDKKTRAQGAPVWVYFVAFAGVLAFVACMLLMPRDRAFLINGNGLIIFGGIIISMYGIRMAIAAFMEDTVCGLLWLFVPFYQLYYLATRWSRLSGFFMLQLLGVVFIFIGWGMVYISPNMAIKEDREDVYLPQSEPPASVACVDFEFNHLPLAGQQEDDRTPGIVA